MLGRLIAKEVLEHLMSLRFAIACVLCLIVVLCSLFIRWQDYSQVLDDYNQETSMERQRLNRMEAVWRFPRGGLSVYRKPNHLKIFVRGLDDSYGGATQVAARGQLRPIIRDLQNTAVPLFPSIDLVTFVGVIMSLMAVVFGYDAICGEKERGTLETLLTSPAGRLEILLGKFGVVVLTGIVTAAVSILGLYIGLRQSREIPPEFLNAILQMLELRSIVLLLSLLLPLTAFFAAEGEPHADS